MPYDLKYIYKLTIMEKLMKKLLLVAALALTLPVVAHAQQAPAAPPAAPPKIVYSPLDKMPAGTYVLDPTHFNLLWKVNSAGLSGYYGRFTKVEANLEFNPKDPMKSALTVKVDPSSLLTDFLVGRETTYEEKKRDFDFDQVLRGDKWFNVAAFPEITMVAKSMKKKTDKTAVLTAELTFMGVKKNINMDVTFNGASVAKPANGLPVIGFSAKTKIKRSDFGMKTLIPVISDEVEIIIEAQFQKPN